MKNQCSRRTVIRSLTGAGALGVVSRWGDTLGGSLEKKSGFIDAHVHVWTQDTEKYPLFPSVEKKDMNPASFTPEDLFSQMRPSGVDRVNLIQMSYYGFDNSYMLDVIDRFPETFVGTAVVDPYGPDLEEEMVRLSKRGVRAFRIHPSLANQPPESWLRPDQMENMFGTASETGLVLSALINLEALPELDRICDKYPDAAIIIDHLCLIGAGDRHPMSDANINSLTAMARHKNVYVKIGAFYALGEKEPPYLDLLPLIRRVVAAFTPDRCMWETDCPFQVANHSYEDSIALIRDHAGFLSASDKDSILRGTAERLLFND